MTLYSMNQSKVVRVIVVVLTLFTLLAPAIDPSQGLIARAEPTAVVDTIQPTPETNPTADPAVTVDVVTPITETPAPVVVEPTPAIDAVPPVVVPETNAARPLPAQCGDGVKNLSSEQCDGTDFGGLSCGSLGFTGGSLHCNNFCQIASVQCTGSQYSCQQPAGSGWWGEYFDYKSYDPAGQMQVMDYRSIASPSDVTWYQDKYKVMMRIDPNLNFQPERVWFPVDNLGIHEYGNFYGNHNYHFGAHWRATVSVPEAGNYRYYLGSDDDVWVLVNGVVVVNNSSVHETRIKTGAIHLDAGLNDVQVYYAERHTPEATMQFRFLDNLSITPLPEGCDPIVSAGSVNGLVWNDANGDGTHQAAEVGVGSFGVQLYSGDTMTASTTSAANGGYQFNNVQPGTYRVCEYVPTGWRQTHPDMAVDSGCYNVTVYSATSAGPFDFGVQQLPLCGNNEVDAGEVCDQGSLNGQPLHCNATCSGYTAPICGNGLIESGNYGHEQCDDANVIGGDGCSATCQIEPQTCHSPLDYVNKQGQTGPDGALSLSDATEFTKFYEAAYGATSTQPTFNTKADVLSDGVINGGDYLCAQRYYGNAGPVSCQLDCNNLCQNPLDYNRDYFINLTDGVRFTDYYLNKKTTSTPDGSATATRYLADINTNGRVDYGDYLCAHDQLAQSRYQCPIQCAPVCGDATIQRRQGETCDDGNNANGDGCSSLCRIESNQCDAPVLLDYNADYKLTLDDAVIFTPYYQADNILADANNNGFVDYGDKLCANLYYGGNLLYTCTLACSAYTPICGDTHKDANEQCDDGNKTNGDGCSASCQIETPGGGGPSCGNAIVETGEQCDEGQLNGQPLHCNASCSGITNPVCGNTVKESGEQCDDGNTNNGDGCSASCQQESTPPGGGGGGGGGGGYSSSVRLYIDKKVTPAIVEPGGQVTYTVTITNIGNMIGSNINLTDTMPAGFTFADGGTSSKSWHWDTLTNGQAVTISYLVNVNTKADTGIYINQATASATNTQSVSISAPVEVRKPVVAGVEIVKPKPPVPDKVKVLGFEKLPDTSGNFQSIMMFLGLVSLLSTALLVMRTAQKRS